jgi:uncharacterized protein (DUF736 family)
MNFDNTNSGALFKNDKKQSDKHPDYRGTVNVNGTDFWISAWLKSSKAGAKYMSLAVQPKEAQQAPAQRETAPARQAAAPVAGFDDDIPL